MKGLSEVTLDPLDIVWDAFEEVATGGETFTIDLHGCEREGVKNVKSKWDGAMFERKVGERDRIMMTKNKTQQLYNGKWKWEKEVEVGERDRDREAQGW